MHGTFINTNGLCLPCIVGKLLRKHVGYFTVLVLHTLHLLGHFTGCKSKVIPLQARCGPEGG